MKNTILILSLLAMSITLSNAQVLKVTYSETMDLSKEVSDIEDIAIKKMLLEKTGKPKYFELSSYNQVSTYELKKDDELDESNNTGGAVIIIAGGGGGSDKDIIYKDFKNNKFLRQAEFMSRTFLIEDKLEKNDWQISDETQKIGKYTCQKATLTGGEENITAWFTVEIPSNDGPRNYYGLPGLILKVKTKSLTIEAKNITILKEKIELKKPTKGKKVTAEEFEKIKTDKINNLQNKK